MDKVQKIREEVERLKSQLLRGACSSQVAMETRCKEEAYNEVLAILDTMQEESASEELSQAAITAADEDMQGRQIMEESNENRQLYSRIFRRGFKDGANWQREQMMAKAIDGEVLENYDGKVLEYGDSILNKKLSNCKVFDKVKVIIIKEN